MIGAVFAVDLIRRPEKSWDLQESWKWHDPDANRPSLAVLRFRGIRGLVGAFVVASAGVWIIIKYG
ncbi:hypothetical protein [Tsukamurella tyrosinosolvens]|uniref:hypothetical protein n=1 Tax=Tsukamurella tyrosinosolvens TaxID=57704 RepID=UPI002DD4342A|nr:hypothetical protein [Tsukamurella tyrosinosolvens]MEC4615711.1 hypothetical protein [Tsukamurella tyrosinosolvens]